MSTGLVIAIVVIAAVAFGAIVVLTTARSTDVRGAGALSRETRSRDRKANISAGAKTGKEVEAAARSTEIVKAAPIAVEPFVAPDPEAFGVTRRQFFNRTTGTLLGASLGAFGASLIGYLWYGASGGFGSKISAGKLDDIRAGIRANKGFFYMAEARAWITEYPKDALAKGQATYGSQSAVFAGMQAGIVALYQKCPHLGCRVPECKSSQYFECQCHGSQYNRVGEKKGGPAPRGMDRFGVSVSNGVVTIDTGAVFAGPAIGTNTTGQEAEGPHCVGASGGH